ncbi:MAG: aminotransferase class III-fold pyridoxal phosphate-dependent enzyme [Pseudomonadota bacterium]
MKASTLQAREREHLLSVYAQLDFEPVRGEGAHLIDATGRRVLDLYGGHAVAALGYDDKTLGKALCDQWQALPFQSNAVAMDVRASAAEALVKFAPPHLTHAFFVNSGAEANENALRLAFLATGRKHVVAVEHAFHGRTAAAGAVTWGSQKRWYGFPSAPFDVTYVPRDDVEAALQSCNDATAAIIFEPVQGVAGAYDLSIEFVQALAESATRSGALLIADEVQSGMGRSGAAFAFEHAGVKPNIATCAKSLGGGFPCGAVLTSSGVADYCQIGDLGTTFGGGPMASAAIRSVVESITEHKLIDNARAREEQVRAQCVVGPITGAQGKGLLLGLQTEPPAREVRDALLKHDILTGTSGDPHVLRLLPPLNITPADIELLASALRQIDAETTS